MPHLLEKHDTAPIDQVSMTLAEVMKGIDTGTTIDNQRVAKLGFTILQALKDYWNNQNGPHGRLSPECIVINVENLRVRFSAPSTPLLPEYYTPFQSTFNGDPIPSKIADLHAIGVMLFQCYRGGCYLTDVAEVLDGLRQRTGVSQRGVNTTTIPESHTEWQDFFADVLLNLDERYTDLAADARCETAANRLNAIAFPETVSELYMPDEITRQKAQENLTEGHIAGSDSGEWQKAKLEEQHNLGSIIDDIKNNRESPLTLDQVAALGLQLAEILEKNEDPFGDITPESISIEMLDEPDNNGLMFRILGIQGDDEPCWGGTVDTSLYQHPQQRENNSIAAKTEHDEYAIAVILTQLLTGKWPQIAKPRAARPCVDEETGHDTADLVKYELLYGNCDRYQAEFHFIQTLRGMLGMLSNDEQDDECLTERFKAHINALKGEEDGSLQFDTAPQKSIQYSAPSSSMPSIVKYGIMGSLGGAAISLAVSTAVGLCFGLAYWLTAPVAVPLTLVACLIAALVAGVPTGLVSGLAAGVLCSHSVRPS